MVDRCQGTTVEGNPCGAVPRPGTSLCAWHTPELAAQRATWSSKGGSGRAHDARAAKAMGSGSKDTRVAQVMMMRVLTKLEDGEIDPAIATAMATVARSVDALSKTNAIASFEQQITAMRAELAELAEQKGA